MLVNTLNGIKKPAMFAASPVKEAKKMSFNKF